MTAALFDLDGTLTDPEEGITRCIAYGLERTGAGIPSQAELRDWIGAPLQASFRRFLGSEALAADALRFYRERFVDTGMFENRMFDGMQEELARIRGFVTDMRVVTSKPTVFATRIIEHFGLDAFFDGVHGSELDGRFSDKSELLGQVLDCAAIDPSRAVMVGDRRFDIEAASRHGVPSVGVLWGFGSEDELAAAGATRTCPAVGRLAADVIQLL